MAKKYASYPEQYLSFYSYLSLTTKISKQRNETTLVVLFWTGKHQHVDRPELENLGLVVFAEQHVTGNPKFKRISNKYI